MSNNAPDYEDNLFFPPTITWTELVEWAKGVKGAEVYDGCIVVSNLEFLETGEIYLHPTVYDIDGNNINACISENRTPEQMKAIIEALED